MNKYDLRKWKKRWQIQPIFVIGNGPSLKQHDLSLLTKYFTIGINRVLRVFDPTILLWQDIELWNSEKENILNSNCAKVCPKKADPDNLFSHFKLIEHIKSNKKITNWQLAIYPDLLYKFANSGILGVQLAITIGASPIVLLGMDAKYDGDKTNFYGDNRDHNEGTLGNFQFSLNFLKKNGRVPIYNCSDNGLWKKYENLEEVINKIKPKKYNRNFIIDILNGIKRR